MMTAAETDLKFADENDRDSEQKSSNSSSTLTEEKSGFFLFTDEKFW